MGALSLGMERGRLSGERRWLYAYEMSRIDG